MAIGGLNVAGVRAPKAALIAAGAIGVVNAGIVLTGWGQSPKSASEKVGTAISHGALLGATTIAGRGGISRVLLLGALAGDVSGNLLSAAIRGDDAKAPRPRPGNAWDDIVGGAWRDAKHTAGRNALIGGAVGVIGGGVAGALITHRLMPSLMIGGAVGGASAGVGAISGGMSGAWHGLYQGTGIAIGRGIDALRD